MKQKRKESLQSKMELSGNEQIRRTLEELAEKEYGEFSSGLIPGEKRMLGVRLPKLREIAKELAKGDWKDYLENARDDSMEETLLQGMTLGYVKASFADIQPYLDTFVPKINNWSVCDSSCATLKIAKKEPEAVWEYLQKYLGSAQEFEIRFGVVMILNHFISKEYMERIFAWMDQIHHPGYYVKMAVAWNLSVCYVKYPKETWEYLKICKLDDWTYNKAIQKMLESYRVSEADKAELRSRKR